MFCANCSDKILDEPLNRRGEYFCSAECANIAQGIDPDDPLLYEDEAYDSDFLEEFET